MHVFDFLGNSILKEVLSAIQKGKPGAFSPGKPKEFLRNYKASLGFLDFLEGILMLQLDYFSANNVEPELDSTVFFFSSSCFTKAPQSNIYTYFKGSYGYLESGWIFYFAGYCLSKSAVTKFRSEPAYTDFMRQWNVGVYFSLR